MSVLLWGSPCCLFSAYQEPFFCSWSGWGVSLTTHLYLCAVVNNAQYCIFASPVCLHGVQREGFMFWYVIIEELKYLQLFVAATTITFSFVGPADNGGQPVRQYAVQYKEERKDWRDARNKTWPVGMYPLCSKVWYSLMI